MFSELASTSPTAPTVCSKPAVGGAKGGGVDVFTDRHFHADETAKISAASASSGKPNFFIKPTLLRGSAFGRRLYFSPWRITSAQSVLFGRMIGLFCSANRLSFMFSVCTRRPSSRPALV